jgi:hypothetical protein
MRFLVVDDSQDSCDLTEAALLAVAYTDVRTAHSAWEAFKMLDIGWPSRRDYFGHHNVEKHNVRLRAKSHDLVGCEPALFAIGADKHVLDILCGTPRDGEADRCSDSANAVDQAIGGRDRVDNAVRVAGQVRQLRPRVVDLAGERGREAPAHRLQAIMKKVGLHVSFPPQR